MEKYEIQKLRDLPIEKVAEQMGMKVEHHKALCPFHDDHHATLSSIFLSSTRNRLAARLSQGCSKNLAYLLASKEEDFSEEEPPELSSGEESPDEESPGEEVEEEASLFLSSSS